MHGNCNPNATSIEKAGAILEAGRIKSLMYLYFICVSHLKELWLRRSLYSLNMIMVGYCHCSCLRSCDHCKPEIFSIIAPIHYSPAVTELIPLHRKSFCIDLWVFWVANITPIIWWRGTNKKRPRVSFDIFCTLKSFLSKRLSENVHVKAIRCQASFECWCFSKLREAISYYVQLFASISVFFLFKRIIIFLWVDVRLQKQNRLRLSSLFGCHHEWELFSECADLC